MTPVRVRVGVGAGRLGSNRARQGLLGVAAFGAAAFAYALFWGDAERAWNALLVNALFFGGLAHAGVVFSAMLQVTSARWGRPLKRLAEATIAFTPVAFVLLLVLLSGIAAWAPWVAEPIEAKHAWLNVPFFVMRQAAGFLALSGVSLAYVYHSVRPDIGLLHESGQAPTHRFARLMLRMWRDFVREQHESQRRQSILAPVVLIAYAWVYSLVAFDFVMALDPHWFSTLVGGQYFVGNLFLGLAFVTVAAVWVRHRMPISRYIGDQQLHDIGKLLFGFSILWAYMVWSQYLVIWYGDLPEETDFIAHRLQPPWAAVSWSVAIAAFVVPFVVLLSRAVKTSAPGLFAVALLCIAGMWLERFVLIVPSMWHHDTVPLGLLELAVTAGVGSLFVWCYLGFLSLAPVLPLSDPRLATATEPWLPPPVSQPVR